jgi:hypothetical protein
MSMDYTRHMYGLSGTLIEDIHLLGPYSSFGVEDSSIGVFLLFLMPYWLTRYPQLNHPTYSHQVPIQVLEVDPF